MLQEGLILTLISTRLTGSGGGGGGGGGGGTKINLPLFLLAPIG